MTYGLVLLIQITGLFTAASSGASPRFRYSGRSVNTGTLFLFNTSVFVCLFFSRGIFVGAERGLVTLRT